MIVICTNAGSVSDVVHVYRIRRNWRSPESVRVARVVRIII